MNGVRNAIDRIAAGFDPQSDGLEDLSRRRRRDRVRRRVAAGTIALAVAAGGALLLFVTFPDSKARTRPEVQVLATWPASSMSTPSPATSSSPVACPRPSGDSPPPVVLSSTSGAAGSSIDVSGRFWNSELWMQLLWNAGALDGDVSPPPWPATGPDLPSAPAASGPVLTLAKIEGPASTGACSFHTSFTVPDVEPGTYLLRWVSGDTGGSTGPSRGDDVYYLFSGVLTFRVTA
jgi:hypothetical protein